MKFGGKNEIGKKIRFGPNCSEVGKIVGIEGKRFIVLKANGETVIVRGKVLCDYEARATTKRKTFGGK